MGMIIQFSPHDKKELRKKHIFRNRTIQVEDEEGILKTYPCIVLYEIETNIPILYSGLERYAFSLSKGEKLDAKTLSIRAFAVCHFLNFMMWETEISELHLCTLNVIREFLRKLKLKDDGTLYHEETWLRYRDYVTAFLSSYYLANKDYLPFSYSADDLASIKIVEFGNGRKRLKMVNRSSLHITPPQKHHHKNRVLLEGYLELLLFEAKKYMPDIVLGIALGAYAGLREGEVVNVSFGSICLPAQTGLMRGGSISIDLWDTAPFFKNWNKKTNPGAIKKYRKQEVYRGFTEEFRTMYYDHLALMESRGFDTSANAPVFVNKQGNPMTVQTYSNRIKRLFYDFFLPNLTRTCKKQGTYMDHAAFIEGYEEEYPGAHMFRHWFTMYLLTKAKLDVAQIQRLRGDSNPDSMNDYIHENDDLIKMYKEVSYAFQAHLLEDANSDEI